MTIIKKKNLVSMPIIILILVSSFTFAQNDPIKNQQEAQNQKEIKNMVQSRSEGENQIMNQIPNTNQEQSKSQNQNQVQNHNQIHGFAFIDLDGDGINDNAIDSDGDGIPNGQDLDYVRPKDGTGQQNKYGRDNKKNGYMWGPNDGTGYGSAAGSRHSCGTGYGGNKRGGRK